MKKRYINAFLLISTILVIAFVSLNIGQNISRKHHDDSQHKDAHTYLHQKLNITDEQEKKLSQLEKKYQKRKAYLEKSMSVANMELADAISRDKSYSKDVQNSVDKIHNAMGEMQKTTLEHLFEMQNILDEKQNEKLIDMITNSLYDNTGKQK